MIIIIVFSFYTIIATNHVVFNEDVAHFKRVLNKYLCLIRTHEIIRTINKIDHRRFQYYN